MSSLVDMSADATVGKHSYVLEFDQFDNTTMGGPVSGALLCLMEMLPDGSKRKAWSNVKIMTGILTCNQAGYQALAFGLEECVKRQLISLTIRGNCEQVLNNLRNTEAHVNNKKLKPLHKAAVALIARLPERPVFECVPRSDSSDLTDMLRMASTIGTKVQDGNALPKSSIEMPGSSDSSSKPNNDERDAYKIWEDGFKSSKSSKVP